MSRIRRSLPSKLNLGILLLAAPVFILTLGLLYIHTKYLIYKAIQEQAFSVLNTAQQQMKNYMSTIETSVNANTWFIQENWNPDSLKTISRRIVQLNQNARNCFISTAPNSFPQYGHRFFVYSANIGHTIVTQNEPIYENSGDEWYKAPLNLGKACWLDPFVEQPKDPSKPIEAFVAYSKPLRGKDGKMVGVISASLSLNNLAEVLNNFEHPYPEAYLMLVGNQGRYLIHPDTTRLFKQTISTGIDPVKQKDLIVLSHEMSAGKKGGMNVTLDGVETHVTYMPVKGTNWSIALVCPEAIVMNNFIHLSYIVIAIIIVGLLIILLLCRHAVNQAISPLGRLIVILKKISNGNYDEFIKTTKREDAVGQLQNSFSSMLETLYFHMGIVRHSAAGARQRNEELAIATEKAREAAIQKTAFIQDVSHQIRTPLNIVMGFATVLRDNIAAASASDHDHLKAEEVANIVEIMKHNTAHMIRMVYMLYDSSEIGTFEEQQLQKNEQVACNDIVSEAIEFMKFHFPGKPIRIHSEIPDNTTLLTNRLYLMRTLRELLYNAAKYSDGQHITLTIQGLDTKIRFIVEDKGPGIPEDARDMIFKPFTKVNDLAEGLGLGLPLAKRHAINLGGDLILDTSYSEGCRFILEVLK